MTRSRRSSGRAFRARHGALLAALALAASLAASGCDGPSGPGALTATVTAPQALGGAVIEVVGPGIRGFEGAGGSQVFSAAVSTAEGRHRVLVMHPDGGTLRFAIRVDDVSQDAIGASVVHATSPTNDPVAAAGLGLRVER